MIHERWAIEWRSDSRVNGPKRYFLWKGPHPLLFDTRRAARSYIAEHYSYIARRPDLRAQPHALRMPSPVKVRVELTLNRIPNTSTVSAVQEADSAFRRLESSLNEQ
jgi:hypothetical protein